MTTHKFIKKFHGEELSEIYNSNQNYNSNKNNNYNSNRNSKANYNSNSIKLKYGSNKNNLSENTDIDKLSVANEQLKFNNRMNTFNNMNNNSITLNTNQDEKVLLTIQKPTIEDKMIIEDENIFDENAGGLEYYKYLERTVSYFY